MDGMNISGNEKPTARHYACPRCRGSNLRRWKLPHPMLVHWVLNPVLVFNELVLGQRVPRLQLVCETCTGTPASRTFVPCPSCGVMHDARIWSGGNAYGHWLGFVCPTCSKRIPSLWNLTSLAVLAVTAPLWYLPHLYYFRDRPTFTWLRAQPLLKPEDAWWRMGLAYGSLMWAVTSLLPQLLEVSSGAPFRGRDLLIGALLWYSGGLVFGFGMRLMSSRRNRGGNRRI
jgi:hypothetical protein